MSNERNKPNFFILGAPKCGTTTIYEGLAQHPEACMSSVKEPNFFADGYLFSKGFDSYVSKYFGQCGGSAVRGEATPRYLRMHDQVIPRLKQLYSNQEMLRFIIVLRDPVKRAWSHYLHQVRNGIEEKEFEEALNLEESRLRDCPELWFGYFKDGLYSEQIRPWFEAYPRENFLILFTHELAADPVSTMKRVYSFLGIDDTFEPEFRREKSNPASKPRSRALSRFLSSDGVIKSLFRTVLSEDFKRAAYLFLIRSNVKPYSTPPQMPEESGRQLRIRFSAEIAQLEELLHKDLSCWKAQSE